MKKYLKRILTVFQAVLLTFLFIIVIFSIVTTGRTNTGKESNILGYRMYTILSDSMKPEFRAGDLIIVKVVDVEDIKSGDIITFFSDDPSQVIVTHKIVGEKTIDGIDVFITKGINSNQVDEYPVHKVNILGRYSFSLPKLGYLFQFLKNPSGYLLFILLPLLIIFIFNSLKVIKLFKSYKKEKEEARDNLLLEEKLKYEKVYQELTLLKEQLNKDKIP